MRNEFNRIKEVSVYISDLSYQTGCSNYAISEIVDFLVREREWSYETAIHVMTGVLIGKVNVEEP